MRTDIQHDSLGVARPHWIVEPEVDVPEIGEPVAHRLHRIVTRATAGQCHEIPCHRPHGMPAHARSAPRSAIAAPPSTAAAPPIVSTHASDPCELPVHPW